MDFAVTIPHLPFCDIEGTVEVTLLNRGRRATWHDPAEAAEIELGTIQRMVRRSSLPGGSHYDYEPFPSDELGKMLEQAVRDALMADVHFLDCAVTEALENAASDRADAMERRWEERREQRAMDAAE